MDIFVLLTATGILVSIVVLVIVIENYWRRLEQTVAYLRELLAIQRAQINELELRLAAATGATPTAALDAEIEN